MTIQEDNFSILPSEPSSLTTLKLYMPMSVDTFEKNHWGDYVNEAVDLPRAEAVAQVDRIQAALRREQSASWTTGMMDFYCHQDGVKEKVRNLIFSAEVRDDQLWGVAECQLSAPLTDKELDTLKDYITGQVADGLGEGFEQRSILTVDKQKIFVHLWSDADWDVETEQERFGSEELTFHEQTF